MDSITLNIGWPHQGELSVKLRRRSRDPKVWVQSRVTVDPSGCWLWNGCKYPSGYGRTVRGPAHREVWRRLVGPLNGFNDVLHHDCGQRACVRPDHLRRTTRSAHMLEHANAWKVSPEVKRANVNKYMRKWKQRQRERGGCRMCSALAVPGITLCRRHREAEAAYKAGRRATLLLAHLPRPRA